MQTMRTDLDSTTLQDKGSYQSLPDQRGRKYRHKMGVPSSVDAQGRKIKDEIKSKEQIRKDREKRAQVCQTTNAHAHTLTHIHEGTGMPDDKCQTMHACTRTCRRTRACTH